MTSLDWQATARGAVVGLAMILIAGLAATVLGPSFQGTVGAALFLGWTLLAFVIAGYLAGDARLDVPVAHGIAAAVLGAVVALVIPLAGGPGQSTVGALVRSATIGAVAATCGAGGGLLADRRHRHRRARVGHRARATSSPDH